MTQFEAFKGLYTGTHALVLGPVTIVYLADTVDKIFVVEQHGQVIDQGRLSPLQAKHFTEAATGAREIARTAFDLGSFTHGATA